jgi:hypothetical protein
MREGGQYHRATKNQGYNNGNIGYFMEPTI